MSADPATVDTNVLVYAHFPSSPYYSASYGLLQQAEQGVTPLCVFPQTVTEFISVVTNPKRVTPAKTVGDAVKAIQTILSTSGITFLPLPEKATDTFLHLLLSHPAIGPKIYDRQLAATMIEHQIKTIYTFNVKDFTGIPNITAVEPTSPAPPTVGTP